jgi:hypothetical protein
MSYADIDINLTDEQIAMRDLVRKFGAEVIRPAGIALDKLPDPADAIEKIFRDARASMIEDGVNETLALSAIDML